MAIVPDLTLTTADLYQAAQGRFPGSNPNDSSAGARTANTAAIQAAIDYAWSNGISQVNLPPGIFYCDPGIYLDAPGNLRTNLGTPSIFNFSLHLKGAGGLGNHEGVGTQLHFTDNTTNAVIVGTGQGMRVSDLSILGPAPTSRAALPANGIGLALAGGSSGLSRCLIENIWLENFRKGVVTGFNSDGLCDSVTIRNSVIAACYIGVHFSRTQNYVNDLIKCGIGNNTIDVLSDVSKPVNVYGGNYSTPDGNHAAFAITAVSSLTYFLDSTQLGFGDDNASFTVHITSPNQIMIDGAYDIACINTTAFGPVPLLLMSYNSGTQVATYKFYQGWLQGIGLQASSLNGGALKTLMESALSGATTLYACERSTIFSGTAFNVDGAHIENANVVTRLFHFNTGFGGFFSSRFNQLTLNWTLPQTGGSTEVFNCQQCFPFIEAIQQSKGCIELSNIVGTAQSDRILIDVQEASPTLSKRLIVRNCDLRPNIRAAVRPTSFGPANSDYQVLSTGYGWGEYDETPFIATGDTLLYYAHNSVGAMPFRGYYPAPHAVPHIDPTTLGAIASGPGAIGTYPALMGHVPYRVEYPTPIDTVGGVPGDRWVESDHQYWSYGQNLSINWSYVGGTNVVVMSSVSRMFAGLHIILNNGGGDEKYVVTGVYPTLGFVTVVLWRSGTGNSWLAGTFGTTYTGSTVKQQAFSFSHVGFTAGYP